MSAETSANGELVTTNWSPAIKTDRFRLIGEMLRWHPIP